MKSSEVFFPLDTQENQFVCKRCGKCCLSVPCIFAQVKYNITTGSKRQCPSLIEVKEGKYKCALIERDPEVAEVLISGRCDDPALEHSEIDAKEVVREFFPEATDEEIEVILWEQTSFPEFWNIPKDGWTPLQCLRTQLGQLKARIAEGKDS